MIQVEHLSKYFGPVMAVHDVSFQVDKNEIVGLLGNNGAGKTTIMRILTTFLPASSGVARVAGFDVMTESMDVRRRIGYLPESIPLYPEMRVAEYLDYRAKLKGVDRRERPAASPTAWTAAASARWHGGCSARCPRATASASAWPTPCSPIRRSSFSTSRPTA